MDESFKIIYERIIPFKLPPFIFWPVISIINFIFINTLIRVFSEENYIWSQLCFALLFAGVPLVLIGFKNLFKPSLVPLRNILWQNENYLNDWITNRLKQMYSFKSKSLFLTICFSIIMSIFIITILGMPFNSLLLNIYTFLYFMMITIIFAHGIYCILYIIFLSMELSSRQVTPPFYVNTKSVIVKLQSSHSLVALFSTIVYVIFIVGVWMGPYGSTDELIIWSAIGALFPPLFFVITFYQNHIIMQKVKHHSLDIINKKVNEIFSLEMKKPKSNMSELEKYMKIQDYVSTIAEWPVELQSIITILIAITTASIQIYISLAKILTP